MDFNVADLFEAARFPHSGRTSLLSAAIVGAAHMQRAPASSEPTEVARIGRKGAPA